MGFIHQHFDTILLTLLIAMQAFQGYLAFEVSVKPKTDNLNLYRAAFVIVTVVGIACAVTMTRRNGALDDQMHREVHTTAGQVQQIYDAQIGHPQAAPVQVSKGTAPTINPVPRIDMEITSAFAHGDAPPPAIRILKLWVTVKNNGNRPVLINNYGLSVVIPNKGTFAGHEASPFTDDSHFVSLESQTGNQELKSNGEVQGNLMFAVPDIPVKIDADPNTQFVLTARANGRLISISDTIAQISGH